MYQHNNEHLRRSQESEPQTWELVSKPQYCHPWALVGDLDAFSKQLTSLCRMMSLCRQSPAKTTIIIHPFLLPLPISSKISEISENTFHSIKKKKKDWESHWWGKLQCSFELLEMEEDRSEDEGISVEVLTPPNYDWHLFPSLLSKRSLQGRLPWHTETDKTKITDIN